MNSFMTDLRERLANKVQLTTDGHRAYLSAVQQIDFDADYAMLIKLYGRMKRAWVAIARRKLLALKRR
jgi:hypothetical protein